MRGTAIAFVALILLAAACGGTSDVAPSPAGGTEAPVVESTLGTEAPSISSTAAPAGQSDTTPPSQSEQPDATTAAPQKEIDGDPAPDFTLALGQGDGEFSLSGEQKPVYMVFWAEW